MSIVTITSDKNARRECVNRIIDAVLEGSSLRQAAKAEGLDLKSFGEWLQTDKECALRYSRAQELRGDVLADEIISIADNEPDAAKARNQITARQWLASKLNKKYGDRVDLNVSQTIDVSSTLLEARARLRPVSYLQDISDAQPREFIGVSEHGAHDKQSLPVHLDVPKEGAEPDIFS